MRELSKYYNSFSGTDTLAFMLLPGAAPITLGALTTISYSIYRDKKPVNIIGDINIKGFTRGTRVVAGTLVFTLINKHWINEVKEACPWLGNFRSLKADELPLFDIMIISANEYGSVASMFIYGVDITDESQTLSVEDMFTENQFSYVARDVDVFDDDSLGKRVLSYKTEKELTSTNYWSFTSTNGIVSGSVISDQKITDIQNKLYDLEYGITTISGVFDEQTKLAIIDFQQDNGMNVSGYLDKDTELKILYNEYDDTRPVVVSNNNGAVAYKEATTTSDIVIQLPYSTKIVVLSKTGEWYKTTLGFIHQDDLKIIDETVSTMPDYLTFGIPAGTVKISATVQDGYYTTPDFFAAFYVNVLPPEDVTPVVNIVNYFSNGEFRSIKKGYDIKTGISTNVTLSDFNEMFLYNTDLEEFPAMTEVFFGIKDATYKWIVKYEL